ncbi:MAG: hypothetical protein OXC59_04440 [Acidimicrobiaceae bacterium]|nr:hypothetical protein [Acidimicrobiaceae bacterium]
MTRSVERPVSEAEGSDRSAARGDPAAARDRTARDLAKTSRDAAWGWRSNFDQLMPVVLFLVFFNFESLRVAGLNNIEIAIIAASAWSVKAAYSRRRRGLPIGAWLPVITAYLLLRAGISIAVERDLVDFGVSTEAVYFGIGIGTKMLVGLAAAATVIAGRPAMMWAARRFMRLPGEVYDDPDFVTTMRNVTWVVTFYEVGSAVWDFWLYNNASVNWFLVTRQGVNFFAAFLVILATLLYVDRRFSRIEGCPTLPELISRAASQTART